MEKEIYNANPLEALKNEMFRLQRLQEGGGGGKPLEVSILIEQTWDKITEIIHGEDEKKLGTLRERIRGIIHDKIVMEEWTKDQEVIDPRNKSGY